MDIMINLRRYYFPLFLLYALISGAIIAVGFILFPENRSHAFAVALFTVELLLAMPFLAFSGFVIKSKQTGYGYRIGGVLPLLQVVVLSYVVLMIGLLFCNLFIYDLGSAYLILQIVLTSVCMGFAVVLQIVVAGAEQGTEVFSKSALSPEMLVTMLKAAEMKRAGQQSDQNLVNSLVELREAIAYKLPSVGAITANTRYKILAENVRNLIDRLASPVVDGDYDSSIIQTIRFLKSEIVLIQSELQ
ncbi:MAG: hypothetical protein ACRCUY_01195 [Thermoguttaceae bacterium]